MNQRWTFTGALRADAAPTLCLDRSGDKNVANVTARTCDGTTEPVWDYYFGAAPQEESSCEPGDDAPAGFAGTMSP